MEAGHVQRILLWSCWGEGLGFLPPKELSTQMNQGSEQEGKDRWQSASYTEAKEAQGELGGGGGVVGLKKLWAQVQE